MGIKSILARAPTRIDLAGGTLDIWPIYLFLKNAVTINLAIDLFAEARLEITSAKPGALGNVRLESEDQKIAMEFSWGSGMLSVSGGSGLSEVPAQLELHYKLLLHFAEVRSQLGRANSGFDLKLTTLARSPAGAGLGGSSSLTVALIGALATWARDEQINAKRDGEAFIELARDVETTVIRVPAGMQDYYGAMYGGLQSIHWKAGATSKEPFSKAALEHMGGNLVLFYSGQSRNSGINNWSLFKGFIDGTGDVRDKFAAIAAATRDLEAAITSSDWKKASDAINQEWLIRRTLASGITTSEMDKAFALTHKAARVAGKVCGAGGGGCFFVYAPDGNKERVIDTVLNGFLADGDDEGVGTQMKHLPFKAVASGLEVTVSRA